MDVQDSPLVTGGGGQVLWGTQSSYESWDHSVEGRTQGAGGMIPNARDSISPSSGRRAVLL